MAPTREFIGDRLDRNGQPGGKALQDPYERGSMRFPGGQITKPSHLRILAPSRARSAHESFQDLFTLAESELVISEKHRGAFARGR
jgi:hypothetical protein